MDEKRILRNEIVKVVNYSVTQRKNPIKPEDPPKYHANAQIWSSVTEKDLATMISRRCTVTRHDLLGVLSALVEVMNEVLISGQSVRIANFGSFHLSIQSDGTDHEDEFTPECITGVNIRFAPGEEFKTMTKLLKFTKVQPKYEIISNNNETV